MAVHHIKAKPVVTEKSSSATPDNQYVFHVSGNKVNKYVLKDYFSALYPNHTIRSINVINYKPTSVRKGRYVGQTQAFKKVYLTLDGEPLDLASQGDM